jgi:hypothetical protein
MAQRGAGRKVRNASTMKPATKPAYHSPRDSSADGFWFDTTGDSSRYAPSRGSTIQSVTNVQIAISVARRIPK